MIATGRYQHTQYLKVLAAISSRLKDPALRKLLLTAPDTETVYQLLINQGD
jgi:mannitol/fructose-specific phosphotransferase system IIA component (Ntr-type)